MAFLEQPTAQYSLQLKPASISNNIFKINKYGKWILMDRKNKKIIAKLTTSNTLDSYSSLSSYIPPVKDGWKTKNCRYPNQTLFNKIVGFDPKEDKPFNPEQFVSFKKITSKTDVETIKNTISKIPTIYAISEKILRTREENDAIFNPSSENNWRLAVEDAKENGFSVYFSKIFDWKERQLISLEVTSKDKEHKWWHVYSVGQGFLALSKVGRWYEDSKKLIIFYNKEGDFRWAFYIEPPKIKNTTCEKFEPSAVYKNQTHLILDDQCAQIQNNVEGEIWKIPLSKLPEFK